MLRRISADLTPIPYDGIVSDMTLKLDESNRVEVPEDMRNRFDLKPGDELKVIVEVDGIRLRPANSGGPLAHEDGVLVCTSELPARWDLEKFLDEQREQRVREISGV